MGRRIGIIASPRQWRQSGPEGMPHRHLFKALLRLGFEPCVAAPPVGTEKLFHRPVEAVFVWNALKGEIGRCAERLRQEGVPIFAMERGWFDRMNYVQIDRLGFSHRASWATPECFARPCPPQGRERFLKAWGRQPKPVRVRKGPIVVLAQVTGDAQLYDSEIDTPGPLIAAVEAAAPKGCAIRVRPHPLQPLAPGAWRRATLQRGQLRHALERASFCVTINSTAGIESLAMGCPVLCLGPALYAAAGVARQSALADLPAAVADMRRGWRPRQEAVENFLFHLACRQWSLEELVDATCLDRLLNP
ncbi:MAG: DUF6716 putative glycosyltransferase [Planctomycetaceae bacterium]|nr:hypothetical protein [Planctomycetaceae bacterium]